MTHYEKMLENEVDKLKIENRKLRENIVKWQNAYKKTQDLAKEMISESMFNFETK